MKKFQTIALLIALSINFTSVNAETYPRMWKVTKERLSGTPQELFILGVSHNGLDFEYDQYFYNTVLPVFNRATVVYSESARLHSSTTPECINPITKNANNLALIGELKSKIIMRYFEDSKSDLNLKDFNEAEAKEITSALMMIASSKVEKLSEYGLLIALIETYVGKKSEDIRVHPDIVGYLKNRFKEKNYKSIDTPDEMLNAYCELNLERPTYIRKQIENYSLFDGSTEQKNSFLFAGDELLKSIKSHQLSDFFNNGQEFEDSYVCKRNRKWMNTIAKDTAEEVSFFALGIAHLLPATWRKKDCNDLLTMLVENGFKIEVVR